MKIEVYYDSNDKDFKKHEIEGCDFVYIDCSLEKNKKIFKEYVFRKDNLPTYYFYSEDKLRNQFKTKYIAYGYYLTNREIKRLVKKYE